MKAECAARLTGRSENLRVGLAMGRCRYVLRTPGVDSPVDGTLGKARKCVNGPHPTHSRAQHMERIDEVQRYRIASFLPVQVRDCFYFGWPRFYDRSGPALRKTYRRRGAIAGICK